MVYSFIEEDIISDGILQSILLRLLLLLPRLWLTQIVRPPNATAARQCGATAAEKIIDPQCELHWWAAVEEEVINNYQRWNYLSWWVRNFNCERRSDNGLTFKSQTTIYYLMHHLSHVYGKCSTQEHVSW